VGKQHAERDVAAARVGLSAGVDEEFGEDADDWCVEFKDAAFVEEGGGGCGRDGLCERGNVEEGCGRDGLKLIRGDDVSEGLEGDELIVMCDGD
jgi:hypothetical protein